MKVLVTGGAGFIGSTTAAALRDAGHDVTVADDLSRGLRTMVPDDVAFVRADVTDAAAIEPIVAAGHFDACMHFAALIEVGDSMARPDAYFATNTVGTATLLEVMYSAYFEQGRGVFTAEDLVDLAAEVGLDVDAAREMLAGTAYLDQVVQDQVLARTFGANGVPFFVIDRAYGVSGAQPVEAFLSAIDQARAANPS